MAGHPPDLSEEQKAAMRARRSEGAGWAEIAREARAGMLPGTPAFKVHWSTVKKHLKDDEAQQPAIYAELEAKLRKRHEANLRATMNAVEANDPRALDRLMRARGAITQAIKGHLLARDLYRVPAPSSTKQEREKRETFLAGLAATPDPKADAVANDGGDREQGSGRADSDATNEAPHTRADDVDLHAEPVDQAA